MIRDHRVRGRERKATFYQEKESNLIKICDLHEKKRDIIKFIRSESQ